VDIEETSVTEVASRSEQEVKETVYANARERNSGQNEERRGEEESLRKDEGVACRRGCEGNITRQPG